MASTYSSNGGSLKKKAKRMRKADQSAAETGRTIAEVHLPDGTEMSRARLAEAIRWAIIQGQIEARQPPKLPHATAPMIVRQIVCFVDDYLLRLYGADYVELANKLQHCKTRVFKLHGVLPERKLVQSAIKAKARGPRMQVERKPKGAVRSRAPR